MALIRSSVSQGGITEYKIALVGAGAGWMYGCIPKEIASQYSKISYRLVQGTVTNIKYGTIDMENTAPTAGASNYDSSLVTTITTTSATITGVTDDLTIGAYGGSNTYVAEIVLSN